MRGTQGSTPIGTPIDTHDCDSPVLAASTLSKDNIPHHWVLLDNKATVSISSKKKLISNIAMVATSMTRKRRTNLQAQVENHGNVWYDPGGWVNILSLHQVKEAHNINFNSVTQDEFVTGKLIREGTGKVTNHIIEVYLF